MCTCHSWRFSSPDWSNVACQIPSSQLKELTSSWGVSEDPTIMEAAAPHCPLVDQSLLKDLLTVDAMLSLRNMNKHILTILINDQKQIKVECETAVISDKLCSSVSNKPLNYSSHLNTTSLSSSQIKTNTKTKIIWPRAFSKDILWQAATLCSFHNRRAHEYQIQFKWIFLCVQSTFLKRRRSAVMEKYILIQKK